MTSNHDLDPIEPEEAIEMYLDERRHEVAESTLQSHRYRLNQFLRWCEGEEIENLNNFSGRDIHRFRVKRRDEDGLATTTMRGQLATLRIFLRFCASIDAVQPGLDEKIILPTVTADDARDEMLPQAKATEVLRHLEQYRYATVEHALLLVLWHTGVRIGAAVGIDEDDYNEEDQYLALVHRPESGTPLKNKAEGERLVAINDKVCSVLNDWLEVNHPGVTDEDDRKPLFASRFDRMSINRARSLTYEYTRPCVYDGGCPHDRDIEDCEAATSRRPFACPSSVSPHPIRRGSITYHLEEDTPDRVVSDRMDVSEKILERHYDKRSPEVKLNQRRRYLPE